MVNRRKTDVPRNQPQPILAASPVIRDFFTLTDADGYGTGYIANVCQSSSITISKIRHGQSYMSIKRLEHLCDELGYEVIVRKRYKTRKEIIADYNKR